MAAAAAGALGGGGGGLSASGGAAGPATSGVNTTNSFSVGGNAGIGSSTGLSPTTIAIVGAAVVIALLVLRKR
jgi:hypothetical protein